MEVLNLQTVQLRYPPGVSNSLNHCGIRKIKYNSTNSSSVRYTVIRCGIDEPSGKPAPFGQKTKYKDGIFEKIFMGLFARKMEKFAAKGGSRSDSGGELGLLDYNYDIFVDVSKRVMQGRSRMQQQEVVREVLISMLLPVLQNRYLENSGCVGQCVNMCKIPTQDFFTNEFGLPLTMIPNFEDMSCEMVYGQVPPPFEEDPVSKQPCYANICTIANPNSSMCPKLQA
ncbi:hypothetical protein MKX01_021446 [Papaver californicum]|nr:hypothetical protein MKX01_021446 [Papaver californicum]